MPKTSKKSYKKRSSSSKSWLTKYVLVLGPLIQGPLVFSRSLKTTLKTTFFANVTHAATGVFTGYLNPGSCFDPAGDIAAMQPSMYDQLAALYARYLVTDAEVYLEFLPSVLDSSGAGSPNSVAAAYPSTVTTALATYQGAASQSYSQSGAYGNAIRPLKMKFKLNTQKIVGSRLPVIAEDCGALVGASPTTGQNMILPIFLQHSNAAGGGMTLIRCTIIQHVIFDQKIQNVDA